MSEDTRKFRIEAAVAFTISVAQPAYAWRKWLTESNGRAGKPTAPPPQKGEAGIRPDFA